MSAPEVFSILKSNRTEIVRSKSLTNLSFDVSKPRKIDGTLHLDELSTMVRSKSQRHRRKSHLSRRTSYPIKTELPSISKDIHMTRSASFCNHGLVLRGIRETTVPPAPLQLNSDEKCRRPEQRSSMVEPETRRRPRRERRTRPKSLMLPTEQRRLRRSKSHRRKRLYPELTTIPNCLLLETSSPIDEVALPLLPEKPALNIPIEQSQSSDIKPSSDHNTIVESSSPEFASAQAEPSTPTTLCVLVLPIHQCCSRSVKDSARRTISRVKSPSQRMVCIYCSCLVLLCLTMFVLLGNGSADDIDIVLDLDEMKPLNDQSAAILRKLNDYLDMHLVTLRNKSVTCNDGSPAGYYIRKNNNGNGRWIIFLEGGWFCFDRMSCYSRYHNMRGYMSSLDWPKRRAGRGILSYNSIENRNFYDANAVFIPYCSSDAWTGLRHASGPGDYSFHGSLIITEVVQQLLTKENMFAANQVLFTGSSAGGTGVVANLDRVAAKIRSQASYIDVRGLADSGWFLDNEPYRAAHCTAAYNCAPQESIKRASKYWNGQVAEACADRFPGSEWKCYFAYRLYPLLRTPLYVVNFLFDEAQIAADNVGPPIRTDQWQYIHTLGTLMAHTLSNLTAVFAPSCISHVALNKVDWMSIRIDGVTLADALSCWLADRSVTKEPFWSPVLDPSYRLARIDEEKFSPLTQLAVESRRKRGDADDANAAVTTSNRRRRNRERRRKNRQKRKDDVAKRRLARSIVNSLPKTYSFPQHQPPLILPPGLRTNHDRRSAYEKPARRSASQCRYKLIDRCKWPQCNRSCPKYLDPYTRHEMDFVKLIGAQLGLTDEVVKQALTSGGEAIMRALRKHS